MKKKSFFFSKLYRRKQKTKTKQTNKKRKIEKCLIMKNKKKMDFF